MSSTLRFPSPGAVPGFRSVLRVLALAVLLLGLPGTASAVVSTDIVASQPTKDDGVVDITIKDTNSGLEVKVSVTGIKSTDTPAQKAKKIKDATTAAINAAGQLEQDAFSASVSGDTVTVTKTGGGGLSVDITKDTTGEGNKLKTKDSGGNGNNWFWRFVRWLVASNNDPAVPSGNTYTLVAEGFNATVSSDGILTASQLQGQITGQLLSQGVNFLGSTDPVTGQQFLASDFIPVGPAFPSGGITVSTSPGWGDFLGGIGLELVFIPAPGLPALLAAGLGLMAWTRRRA